ncbi:hypothetical protein EYF80_030271 [Liparis tanakae]|uniref:Uncharacterized protein n=1 Tax=Liparis tanakae TaxID=230148 RepID=A0A4Z2H0Z8_9TELE|nr:hypothetical protein EYF80_030271 [Liparis tanakae]
MYKCRAGAETALSLLVNSLSVGRYGAIRGFLLDECLPRNADRLPDHTRITTCLDPPCVPAAGEKEEEYDGEWRMFSQEALAESHHWCPCPFISPPTVFFENSSHTN